LKQFSSTYRVLDKFAIRTPLFPVNVVKNIYSSPDPLKAVWEALNDNEILEAIYLASPELHERISQVNIKEIHNSAKHQKLTYAILKYITRIGTRATPFGLFAGTAIGNFGDTNNLKLKDRSFHVRRTRFDLSFVSKLSRNLMQIPKVKESLLYYNNTSIYKVGNQIRYVETVWEGRKKEYILQRISATEHLSVILEFAKKGRTISSMAEHLTSLGHDLENSLEFIFRLVDNQILISSLEPYCIGGPYHDKLLQELRQFSKLKQTSFLKEAIKSIEKPHLNPKKRIALYEDLQKSALAILPETSKNHLLQVDLFTSFEQCELDKKLKVTLSRALNILSCLTPRKRDMELKKFIHAFTKRYETRAMPLVHVLDIDSGIGYPVSKNRGAHPYISKIGLGNNQKNNNPRHYDGIELFLLKKLQKWQKGALDITDPDLNILKKESQTLCVTISGLAEIIKEGLKNYVYLQDIGGSSASNLLGRFSYGSEDVLDFVHQINTIEKTHYKNCHVAEIGHLPEERTGNILFRPKTRRQQINFLSGTNDGDNSAIPVEDITIQVLGDKITLSSLKTGKKIIPFLSNAHNYTKSKLPMYRFLCDMQFNDFSSGIGFDWGPIEVIHKHLPRMTYKDVIIIKEQWVFETSEIKEPSLHLLQGDDLLQAIAKWRAKESLPRYVQLKTGDNLLLIDFSSLLSINLFLSEITKMKRFKLVEFLSGDDQLVIDGEHNRYASEFLFAFSRKEAVNEN